MPWVGEKEGGQGQHQTWGRIQPNSGSESTQQPSLVTSQVPSTALPCSPLQTPACPWLPAWSAAHLGRQRAQGQSGGAPHTCVNSKAKGAVLSPMIRKTGLNWGSWSMDIKAEQMGKLIDIWPRPPGSRSAPSRDAGGRRRVPAQTLA